MLFDDAISLCCMHMGRGGAPRIKICCLTWFCRDQTIFCGSRRWAMASFSDRSASVLTLKKWPLASWHCGGCNRGDGTSVCTVRARALLLCFKMHCLGRSWSIAGGLKAVCGTGRAAHLAIAETPGHDDKEQGRLQVIP